MTITTTPPTTPPAIAPTGVGDEGGDEPPEVLVDDGRPVGSDVLVVMGAASILDLGPIGQCGMGDHLPKRLATGSLSQFVSSLADDQKSVAVMTLPSTSDSPVEIQSLDSVWGVVVGGFGIILVHPRPIMQIEDTNAVRPGVRISPTVAPRRVVYTTDADHLTFPNKSATVHGASWAVDRCLEPVERRDAEYPDISVRSRALSIGSAPSAVHKSTAC